MREINHVPLENIFVQKSTRRPVVDKFDACRILATNTCGRYACQCGNDYRHLPCLHLVVELVGPVRLAVERVKKCEKVIRRDSAEAAEIERLKALLDAERAKAKPETEAKPKAPARKKQPVQEKAAEPAPAPQAQEPAYSIPVDVKKPSRSWRIPPE